MCLEMCIFEIQINPHRTLIDCLACKFERIQGFSSDFRYLEEFSGKIESVNFPQELFQVQHKSARTLQNMSILIETM